LLGFGQAKLRAFWIFLRAVVVCLLGSLRRELKSTLQLNLILTLRDRTARISILRTNCTRKTETLPQLRPHNYVRNFHLVPWRTRSTLLSVVRLAKHSRG